MQLASKMRFVSAQLLRLLEDDLWRETAGHANAMARRLADGVSAHRRGTHRVPRRGERRLRGAARAATARLLDDYRFYAWDEEAGVVRWMCSWQTTEDDVDAFIAALERAAASSAR